MITGDVWDDVTTLVATPKEHRGALYAAMQDHSTEYRRQVFDIVDRLLATTPNSRWPVDGR